jgi:hypothetical protein
VPGVSLFAESFRRDAGALGRWFFRSLGKTDIS